MAEGSEAVGAGTGTVLGRARPLLSEQRNEIWAVTLYALCVGILALATPVAVQALVNTVGFAALLQPLIVLVALVFLGLVLSAVLKALKAWTAEVLQRRMFALSVARLAYRLPRAAHPELLAKDGCSAVHRFFELFTVQKAAATLLLGGIDVLLMAVVGLVVLAFYHPLLLAFDVLLLISLAGIIFGLGRRGVLTSVEESSAKYAVASYLAEICEGGAAGGAEQGPKRVEDGLDALARKYLAARSGHYRIVLRQFAGGLALQTLSSSLLLGLGGALVLQRELTLGQLVAAELIVSVLLGTLSDFGKYAETYYDLVTSAYKLDGLLSIELAPGAAEARPEAMAHLGVLREVPTGAEARKLAKWLGWGLAGCAVVVVVAPWQQTVSGRGRVIAYAPVERRQTIEAPVNGRVAQWFVREGSYVAKGDPIVELKDNDPDLVERLRAQQAAAGEKLENYEARVGSLRGQIEAARAAMLSELAGAEAKLRVAEEKLKAQKQKLAAAEAGLETVVLNLGRVRALASQGLSATRDLELAELAATKARTERDGGQADVLAAMGDLDAARAALAKAKAEGAAKIGDAEAKLSSGLSDAADARGSLTGIGVTIARQNEQLVRAPRAGVVLQILAAEGGEQVKQGDPLVALVPSTQDRAAEIWIDGNDASLVADGRKVRLQFEGWPAVQFSGWPSVAVGTFGGRIAFVDPHDDGKGNFRALVVPDPADEPWPSPRFLRQGVQAKGWVLLEQVRLGFELWRRFNGFPPMMDQPPGYEESTVGESKGKS